MKREGWVGHRVGLVRAPREVLCDGYLGRSCRFGYFVPRRTEGGGSRNRMDKLLTNPAFRGRQSPLAQARGVD